jgi:sugar phosphate isomerase/epimerase
MSALGMCPATLLADPMGAPSEIEVRAAVEAAVAAGFTDLSVWALHLNAIGDPEALGARIAAVEAATVWATADRDAATSEAYQLVELTAEHGAGTITAATMAPGIPDLNRARDNLAILVDAAVEVGVNVCVEFLPWSGIPTLAVAWELVEPLGRSAGILLDTWHWQRQPGGPNQTLLATIPGERIGYVQVCDAAAQPSADSLTEAMSARLLPGDGVIDFAGLFASLEDIGANLFVATEIFNAALVAERGSDEAAHAMANATLPIVDTLLGPRRTRSRTRRR